MKNKQTKETISGELTFTCDMKPEYMLEKGWDWLVCLGCFCWFAGLAVRPSFCSHHYF